MNITMDVSEQFSDSNDHIITKRKRTKRPRPISGSTSSTNFSLFSYDCNVEKLHNSFSSPSSTSTGLSTTTEEAAQENAANCLMLLARGDSLEIKKVGIYVYECKTCNRAFPSFQALGGHRASHKKPKTITPAQLPKKTGHNQNTTVRKIHERLICGSGFGSGQALGGHMRRHRYGISSSKNKNLKSDINVDAHETVLFEASENARNMLVVDLNVPALPEYVAQKQWWWIELQEAKWLTIFDEIM